MSIAVMQSGRFADDQELRFQTAKSSVMGCATLLEGRFDNSPEKRFQATKLSNMGSVVQQ